MDTADALLRWCEYRARLTNLGLVAVSTVNNQSRIAAGLIDRLGAIPLDLLRKSDIEVWMGGRLATCAPVTIRGEMNVLRQWLNWCVDEGHLTTKPRLPKLAVPSTETVLPSDEAFRWVLANVPAQHAVALEFMMLTGLSPHELERIQERDFDLTRGLGIGQRADFAVKQPSRRRWIPLGSRAVELWFMAASGLEPDGEPFPGVDAMQKAIRRAVDACRPGALIRYTPPILPDLPSPPPPGVDQITPKSMRKWFASKVAAAQPEHVLQSLMGHAPGSPITRRHYVRSNAGQAADAVGGLQA